MKEAGILAFAVLFLGSLAATITATKRQEPELSAICGILAGFSFMGVLALRWGLE